MYDFEEALIVLVEPNEVRQVFPAWPLEMQVAVCLRIEGSCDLAVFRREELGRIVLRLTRRMGLKPEQVGVCPRTEGFAAHRLRFADQRRLLKLVGDTPTLLSEAVDYSANYTFAVEEGIAPEQLLGLEHIEEIAEEPPADPEPVERVETAARQPVAVQVREVASFPKVPASLPSFLKPKARSGPGPGFKSARQILREETGGAVYRIRVDKNGWSVLSRTDKGGRGEAVSITDKDAIHLRHDDGVVAIAMDPSRSALRGMPSQVRVCTTSLPKSLRAALGKSASRVEVKQEDGFLFLYPIARKPDEAEVALMSKPRKRRSIGIGGTLVVAGAMAVFGWIGIESTIAKDVNIHMVNTAQEIDWQDYRRPGS